MIPFCIDDVYFDPVCHEYMAKGQKLSGVTGRIAAKCGKVFPKNVARIVEACDKGSYIHAISDYAFKLRKLPKDGNDEVLWLINSLIHRYGIQSVNNMVKTEWLVSDLKNTASSIDLAVSVGDRVVDIFDIKTGVVDTEYCSMQLGAYQYMLGISRGIEVRNCYVLGTKDRVIYPIVPISKKEAERLLY